jgi:hypothetical protein
VNAVLVWARNVLFRFYQCSLSIAYRPPWMSRQVTHRVGIVRSRACAAESKFALQLLLVKLYGNRLVYAADSASGGVFCGTWRDGLSNFSAEQRVPFGFYLNYRVGASRKMGRDVVGSWTW